MFYDYLWSVFASGIALGQNGGVARGEEVEPVFFLQS
jgi:hypothetical protein